MKKDLLLKAIQQLIDTYADNCIQHSAFACPLCRLFYFTEDLQTRCKGCPNTSFIDLEGISMPCVKRGQRFVYLDYLEQFNNTSLSKFWEAVHIFLSEQTEEDVEEMGIILKVQIHNIAKHYNR